MATPISRSAAPCSVTVKYTAPVVAPPGVALDPHKPVAFHPGAMHIMLEGLKGPLKVGSTFPLTLTFEKAPPQTVTVTVMKAGAPGPAAATQMPGMKMN